jgi:uncharacterized protein (UPF0147 family)
MDYEIISESEYETLPEDAEDKFVALEAICRRNMNRMMSENSSGNFDNSVRLQYMATVSAAAQELGVGEFEFPSYNSDFNYPQFVDFSLKANALVTQLRLRKVSKSNALSVRLASKTRGRIEQQVQILRTIINEAEMPGDQRASLLKKLDELSLELSQNRVSFAKIMMILAFVSVGVTQATGFLADAPQAIVTITSLLGADKEAEDAETRRLGPPPKQKALPSPPPRPSSASPSALDDEIPF